MTTPASNGPTATQDAASAAVGIGGVTSGQAGATPTHETQRETGGSGGAQLTQSTGAIDAPPGTTPAGTPAPAPASSEAEGSAMQTGARGALDTQARQAGGTGTGLGSRESGANQSEQDLPPAR